MMGNAVNSCSWIKQSIGLWSLLDKYKQVTQGFTWFLRKSAETARRPLRFFPHFKIKKH